MQMSNELRGIILPKLTSLKEGVKPNSVRLGICDALEAEICRSGQRGLGGELASILRLGFRSWDHFSGSVAYPVPATDKNFNAATTFIELNNLWDRRTKYGKLRYPLVDHLIASID